MRTTLTLDDDIFEAAQALAESAGKPLGQVVSQLVRRGLRAQADTATKNGLPVFRLPPDTPLIPSNRARDLLADEAP
ncbi:MAG: hypothetical protein U1F68_21240 [Gammaproteobacteria bacterium]